MQDSKEKIADLVDICYGYYIYGETQGQIAKRMGVSVAKISKMISLAHKMGIVHIEILDPIKLADNLAKQLKARYSLKEAKVIPIPRFGVENLLNRLGKVSAELLSSYIKKGDVIGISGGSTLFEMLEYFELPDAKDNVVVPLLGGYKEFEDATHGTEIASSFAKKLNAQLVVMPSPGIVKQEEISFFLSNTAIKRSMSWIPKCNIAVFGIGTADTNGTFFKGGVITDKDLSMLMKENAVGCICLNFYDQKGKPCEDFNSRIIGVSLDDILKIKLTIGVAGGSPEKAKAIQGALNGGYLDVLVTDQLTAESLLG